MSAYYILALAFTLAAAVIIGYGIGLDHAQRLQQYKDIHHERD